MSGAWFVDDIQSSQKGRGKHDSEYLVRLNHLTMARPGGLRYLLADSSCVDIRHHSAEDLSSKFSYGLAYFLDSSALRKSLVPRSIGGRVFRMPLLTSDNFGACLERATVAEVRLRSEIQKLLQGGSAPEHAFPDSGSRGRGEGGEGAMHVHVVNVGQGDTIVLEFPGRLLWIIDAFFWSKKKYDRFKRELARKVKGYTVDRFIVSHFHYDHIRSANDLINDLKPREIVITDTLIHSTATTRNMLRLARSLNKLRILRGAEETKLDGITVRLIRTADFPGNPVLGPDPNEHAICVICSTRSSVVLLAADIPGHLLASLVGSRWLRRRAKYRLYKVTHHCSRTGNDPTFLQGFQADDSVTSCGLVNRFGHPHDPPARSLSKVGMHWKTSQDSRLMISFPVR